MNECMGCGGRMIRHWPHGYCGACFRSHDHWTEQQHEEALRACMALMDPRLRSLPFFIPLGPKKPTYDEELS